MTKPRLDGVIPIAVMPFSDNGAINYQDLNAQIDFMVEKKINWLGFGYGSEVYTLSDSELLEVLSQSVKRSQSKINIVGNLEVTSFQAAAEKLNKLQDTGVEMVMVRPHSMWAQASQDKLIQTLLELDSRIGLRMVYQDAPQNTGVNLSPKSLLEMVSQGKALKALKIEPLSPSVKILEIAKGLKNQETSIIGGLGGIEIVDEIINGGTGTMPGPAFPEVFREIIKRVKSNDERSARILFNKVLPLLLFSNRDMATFLFVQKYILIRRGVLSGSILRMPSSELRAGVEKELLFLLDLIDFESILKECA